MSRENILYIIHPVALDYSNPVSRSKNLHPGWGGDFLAEQQGFEPWRRFHALRDFESRLFDQLEYCSITESLYQQSEEKSIPNHFISCSLLYCSIYS